MDRPRPTPRVMPPKGPDLSPRTQLPPTRAYAVDPNLPQRRRPVTTAMADTGLLYALAHREQYLEKFLALYGDTVAVAQAVADEIRKIHNIPQGRRAERNLVLMGRCADKLVVKLDDGTIPVLPLPPGGGDLLDTVVRLLRDHDRAAAQRRGVTWSPIDTTRALRHAGEAQSIVIAAGIVASGGTSVLLTNDGGASLVAWRQRVSSRHLRDVLAELACEEELAEDDLFKAFAEMTEHFATPPTQVCPKDSSAFRCHAHQDRCPACDR